MSPRSRAGGYPETIRVVDSHTEGEPTRVVVEGWPAPVGETMAARRDDLRARFDHLRSGAICEPRGHEALVGALLTPPVAADSVAGVVFFNNVGYLGMCGHGTIGVVKTLEHMDRLGTGPVRLDTPVGTVRAELEPDGSVTIENVPSFCHLRDVTVEAAGFGPVTGDVAWGGNWFFIAEMPEDYPIDLRHRDELRALTHAIRNALVPAGVAGVGGADIDHIEISGHPQRPGADSRNYVLCPGGEYDRSPCGTGTCAKMAAMHAAGRLPLGRHWRQESVTGSHFTGWLTRGERGDLIPHIRGRAFVVAETILRFDPADPFRGGLAGP